MKKKIIANFLCAKSCELCYVPDFHAFKIYYIFLLIFSSMVFAYRYASPGHLADT